MEFRLQLDLGLPRPGEGRFSWPVGYDLSRGIDHSLEGTPGSLPAAFTSSSPPGNQHQAGSNLAVDDLADLHAADVTNGEPAPRVNLGPAVNPPFIDAQPGHPSRRRPTVVFLELPGGGRSGVHDLDRPGVAPSPRPPLTPL